MSQAINFVQSIQAETKHFIQDKYDHYFPPRRKRLIKITMTLIICVILPIGVVQFGSNSYNKTSFFSLVSRFTDMRVKNVTLGVYNNDIFVEPSDWHVDINEIKDALPFALGGDILSIDPEEVRKEMAKISWVKSAKVKLQLPDEIMISLEENVPFARWQVDGKFYLINEKGKIITDSNLERYDYLPFVVGQDANRFAREYVLMMQDFSDIFSGIKASSRVGQRRWELLTHNNIEISLSEQNPRASLERLSLLHHKYNILEKQISAIDLRIPTKTFLRPTGDSSMRLFEE